ncbi:unnamed protein product, partial [Symbiodinium sp. CCMP2456]
KSRNNAARASLTTTTGYSGLLKDYLVASKFEVQCEAMEVARALPGSYVGTGERLSGKVNKVLGTRGVKHRPTATDLSYLLTEHEEKARRRLDATYVKKFGKKPSDDPNLVYLLGNDPQWTTSWTAVSGRLPDIHGNVATGKFWYPHFTRLCAMTFPVTEASASVLGVPVLGTRDPKRAAQLVAGARSLHNAALIQMIAL